MEGRMGEGRWRGSERSMGEEVRGGGWGREEVNYDDINNTF